MSEFGENVDVDGWTDLEGNFYALEILNCPLQVVRISEHAGARFAIKDPREGHEEDLWIWDDGKWVSMNGTVISQVVGVADADASWHGVAKAEW